MRPIRLVPMIIGVLAVSPLAAQQAAPDSAPRNWHLMDMQRDGFPGISAERAYAELLAGRQPRRQVEPVDRVEKQQRAHPVIEIAARPAEIVQRVRFRQQSPDVQPRASRLQRLISDIVFGGGDELG